MFKVGDLVIRNEGEYHTSAWQDEVWYNGVTANTIFQVVGVTKGGQFIDLINTEVDRETRGAKWLAKRFHLAHVVVEHEMLE